MSEEQENFDRIFRSVMDKVYNNVSKFLDTVLSFIDRKTAFGLQKKIDAQKLVWDSFEKSFHSVEDTNLSNNSFDEFPMEHKNSEFNDLKNANKSYKTKAERKQLTGFPCYDCKDYYNNCDLPGEKLKNMIEKCSRHRATVAPPPQSPKEMWLVDIEGPDPETQILDEPLPTRHSFMFLG